MEIYSTLTITAPNAPQTVTSAIKLNTMAKLLLMEDDVVLGFELKRNLEKAGHEVEVRGTASLAYEALLFHAYDVLITDVVVKENGRSVADGGIVLVGRVRANPKTRTMPIIAISGSHTAPGMEYVLTTIEQVGANVSLEKPFHLDDLLSHIRRLMDTRPSHA